MTIADAIFGPKKIGLRGGEGGAAPGFKNHHWRYCVGSPFPRWKRLGIDALYTTNSKSTHILGWIFSFYNNTLYIMGNFFWICSSLFCLPLSTITFLWVYAIVDSLSTFLEIANNFWFDIWKLTFWKSILFRSNVKMPDIQNSTCTFEQIKTIANFICLYWGRLPIWPPRNQRRSTMTNK